MVCFNPHASTAYATRLASQCAVSNSCQYHFMRPINQSSMTNFFGCCPIRAPAVSAPTWRCFSTGDPFITAASACAQRSIHSNHTYMDTINGHHCQRVESNRQLRVSRIRPKLPAMSSSPHGYTDAGRIIGQYIGKVLILCPDCGNGITSQQNWNTWKVRCKRCHTIVLCGVLARRVAKHVKKRKYVRPIDTLLPAPAPWKSGEPINVLLSDDDDSSDID